MSHKEAEKRRQKRQRREEARRKKEEALERYEGIHRTLDYRAGWLEYYHDKGDDRWTDRLIDVREDTQEPLDF